MPTDFRSVYQAVLDEWLGDEDRSRCSAARDRARCVRGDGLTGASCSSELARDPAGAGRAGGAPAQCRTRCNASRSGPAAQPLRREEAAPKPKQKARARPDARRGRRPGRQPRRPPVAPTPDATARPRPPPAPHFDDADARAAGQVPVTHRRRAARQAWTSVRLPTRWRRARSTSTSPTAARTITTSRCAPARTDYGHLDLAPGARPADGPPRPGTYTLLLLPPRPRGPGMRDRHHRAVSVRARATAAPLEPRRPPPQRPRGRVAERAPTRLEMGAHPGALLGQRRPRRPPRAARRPRRSASPRCAGRPGAAADRRRGLQDSVRPGWSQARARSPAPRAAPRAPGVDRCRPQQQPSERAQRQQATNLDE